MKYQFWNYTEIKEEVSKPFLKFKERVNDKGLRMFDIELRIRNLKEELNQVLEFYGIDINYNIKVFNENEVKLIGVTKNDEIVLLYLLGDILEN